MFRRFILPVAACLALMFAVMHVVRAQQAAPEFPPPIAPATSPFTGTLAGSGIIEPETENISIAAPLPGMVTRVAVKAGDKVEAGQLLFCLDERGLLGELQVRQAMSADARARLERLQSMPRAEEIPPSEAKVKAAQAAVIDLEDQFIRAQKLVATRVMTEEELIRKRQAYLRAREELSQAEANHRLLLAGAWHSDLAVARAEIESAAAAVKQTQIELDRLCVCAPVGGEVLQVNVRPGEYAGTPPDRTLIVLGSVQRLHVRVDIDEQDIPRFSTQYPAVAARRGDAQNTVALRFIRCEPYVIPKRSLTGDNVERVDTRVLQVIYAAEQTAGLFVGQQVDVFLDAGTALAKK